MPSPVPLDAGTVARLSGLDLSLVTVLQTVDSTNEYLKSLAKNGAPAGTAVLAETQTAGRGRLGRPFFSPPGSGLYLSALLRPATLDPGRITTLAAVVTAEAIEEICGLEVAIKWVNDLFFEGKKLCGILTEGAGNGFAILGIGINVSNRAFPPELAPIATSLERACGKVADRNRLAASILAKLKNADPCSAAHMAEYRRRSLVLGREVGLPNGERVRAVGIDDDGALCVVGADGTPRRIATGEVSIKL